jgi:sterol desaturase/sphingolipid hydroxylase (fatty acid hydroxylase superfamily)
MLPEPLRVWLFSFTVDLLRYLLAAGPAFLIFLVWGRRRFAHRSILGRRPELAKMLHDLRWSLSTVLLFSLVAVGVYYGARHGILQRYASIEEYGWGWFFASIGLLIVLQDAYFYWTHRAMHHRSLFKLVHRVHHVSTNPSPWTAYAFAPLEALVHAAFVPLVWLFVPLHESAVFAFLAFMIVRNVLGHLSLELYPAGFTKHRFWRWNTTTTHHALHHARFTSNFGLYFTFWDDLMGTTHPAYSAAFERLTERAGRAGATART